jgi:hypothetical protein
MMGISARSLQTKMLFLLALGNCIVATVTHGVAQRKCHKPKQNVFFLKTHKTGSTTVQNLLLRYGEANNLTFALPKQSGAHMFNYNLKFNPSLVRPSPTGEYNILCNHLHFNAAGVHELMPRDTKFIAIVRHPVELFESVMSYYSDEVRAFQRLPGNDVAAKMKNFLDAPRKYYGYDAAHYEKFAKNGMTWDFGFDNEEEEDAVIQRRIQYLDKVFDLVLITDYFEESIVLLKEELCWTTEEVTFLKANSRKRESQSAGQNLLDSKYKEKLLEWNKADWKLYQHFNATFTKKVEAFGVKRMEQEVAKLKDANTMIQDRCISDEKGTSFFNSIPLTRYKLKNKSDAWCNNFVQSERQESTNGAVPNSVFSTRIW